MSDKGQKSGHVHRFDRADAPGAAGSIDVLVLAGRRRMEGFGGDRAPHKALLDIAGVPMIARVLATLAYSPSVDHITVSIDDDEVVGGLDIARQLSAAGRLSVTACGSSPADSVAGHLRTRARAGRTVLVTTADHPLLTPDVVERFLLDVSNNRLDVTAAVVSASTFRARYPSQRRTFIPFRGGAYTGANLFAFRVPDGASAAEFWRRVETYRKTPWKMAALFGPRVLAEFALRRLDIETAMTRISDVVGCTAGVVELNEADVAIDVDSDEDARIVEEIMRRREAS